MDMVLVNGNVITMGLPNKREQAVAITDGRITKVGSTQAVRESASETARLIDLHGRTLMPGLIDSHMHGFLTGMTLGSARLETATTVDEVCERLHERARAASPGAWVYGMGCAPWALAEGRFPTLDELDHAVPKNPVYVSAITFHSGATNSEGLAAIGMDLARHGVEKDSAGRATGAFVSDDTHFDAARVAFGAQSDAEIAQVYSRVADFVVSRGVTTLHTLDGMFVENDRDVYVLLEIASRLPVHTLLMYQTMDVQRVLELGLPRIGGCLTIDGAGFEHTALMYEPYSDAPWTCGDCYIEGSRVRSFVKEAHEAGLQIGMHAIGDKAIDILVKAYADALEAAPRDDCRHRVEHFSIPTEWAVANAQRMGLALPMQPIFSWLWDRTENSEYVRLLGRERADRSEALAQLSDRGMAISGGSDSPVTDVCPLLGIHAAANHPHPARRVSVEDALRMFTINAAWVGFEEQQKGTIEVGKLADLVILDRDPYQEPEHISEFAVEMTITEGKIVYERPKTVLDQDS
jgi:predicted amidohydrolase YtcJ